jgi:hypothetical protein
VDTIERWLSTLPSSLSEEVPWVLFWLGACKCFANHAEGQRLLERAFERFEIQRDHGGMLAASCAIMESMMTSWMNLTRLDFWLSSLRTLATTGTPFPSIDVEVRAMFILFMAQQWRNPTPAAMATMMEQVESLLKRGLDSTKAMLVGHYLATYKWWMGDYEGAEGVIQVLTQYPPSTLTPVAQLWLRQAQSSYAFARADSGTVSDRQKKASESLGIMAWSRSRRTV